MPTSDLASFLTILEEVFAPALTRPSFCNLIYGRLQSVPYKTFCAQWYRACGTRLLRIIVVATTTGHVPFRVFFCTDDSPARLQTAVLRMFPFVGLLSSVLVLWFADQVWCSPMAAPPVRPWYRQKKTLCFADILRAARCMLGDADISDPARLFNNLQKSISAPAHSDDPPLSNAA